MKRAAIIAVMLLLQACGTSEVNDTTLDPAANRLANDLYGSWTLSIGPGCSGGGSLQVASTLAWVDVNTRTAGANGSGSWNCGGEAGPLSIRVSTQGVVEIVLYRSAQAANEAWKGGGTYAPLFMSGSVSGIDVPWSAHHQ